ncbi:MAG: hypothetical protein IKK33_01035 [Lachnospiraceae bacterium]|nr:hypothetical protein [Lachnospiraceae bacterium]
MEQMNQFLRSLYLGDRWCECMEVGEDRIVFQVNLISRVQKGIMEWNYYSDEDILHGCLVFEEVSEFKRSSDLEFNDEIYEVKVLEKKDEIYTFVVYGCNVSDNVVSTGLEYQIKAKRFYILNPQNNTIIRE